MSERNQDGYQTLGWIINESEEGLFLVIAKESVQKEIADIYRRGMVGIYDYKQNPGSYSFQKLKEYIEKHSDLQTFFIVNFQFAVQEEKDLSRLNFSRDMLTALGKNLIFLTSPYGDELLVKGAYDFYSFLKIRVEFHDHDENIYPQNAKTLIDEVELSIDIDMETSDEKQKMDEAYRLIQLAKDAEDKAEYEKSEALLLKTKEILETVFSSESPELIEIYQKLISVYQYLGWYEDEKKYVKRI